MSSISKGLSAIAKEVLEDVETKAESMIMEAESQAEKILEEAEAEAEEVYRTIVKKGEEETQAIREEKTILFEINAKHRLLQAREEIIDQVFDRALNSLREYASTQEYQDCLSRLIVEACKKINSDKMIIQLNQNDYSIMTKERLKALSKEVGVELVRSDIPIETVAGVVVKSSDGKIVVNNRFENRLDILKSSLRMKIANMLFGEESKSRLEEQ